MLRDVATSGLYLLQLVDHFDDEENWRPVHAPEVGLSYQAVPSYNTMTFCAHCQLHKV